MNTNIPLMVKIADSDSTYARFMPLSCIEFTCDIDGFISYAWRISDMDDNCEMTSFESVDGQIVEIRSLNCKSYDELIVKLHLHNALFGRIDRIEPNVCSDATELEKEVMALKCENKKLKEKLQRITSILEK